MHLLSPSPYYKAHYTRTYMLNKINCDKGSRALRCEPRNTGSRGGKVLPGAHRVASIGGASWWKHFYERCSLWKYLEPHGSGCSVSRFHRSASIT